MLKVPQNLGTNSEVRYKIRAETAQISKESGCFGHKMSISHFAHTVEFTFRNSSWASRIQIHMGSFKEDPQWGEKQRSKRQVQRITCKNDQMHSVWTKWEKSHPGQTDFSFLPLLGVFHHMNTAKCWVPQWVIQSESICKALTSRQCYALGLLKHFIFPDSRQATSPLGVQGLPGLFPAY